MEKKPIEAVAALPRRVAVMRPPQFASIPGLPLPPSRQDRSDDIDGEILDWILSHVRNRKPPRTSLMSVSVFLTGISVTLCGAVTSISPPIGLI
jgi:hypothetical protein